MLISLECRLYNTNVPACLVGIAARCPLQHGSKIVVMLGLSGVCIQVHTTFGNSVLSAHAYRRPLLHATMGQFVSHCVAHSHIDELRRSETSGQDSQSGHVKPAARKIPNTGRRSLVAMSTSTVIVVSVVEKGCLLTYSVTGGRCGARHRYVSERYASQPGASTSTPR